MCLLLAFELAAAQQVHGVLPSWRLSSELVQAMAYAMVTARVQGREAVLVHEAGR